MFCFNCGKEVKEGARFCEFCGQQLDAVAKNEQVKQIIYVQTQKQPKSQFIAILCCLFLGGLGIHDFYMEKPTNGVIKILLTILLGWCYVGLIINFFWCLLDFFIILWKAEPCFYTEEQAKKQTI
jgi:TM2 domain-containing membrane protein YozV